MEKSWVEVYLYLVTRDLASSSCRLVAKMFKGLVVRKKCLARPMKVFWS